MALHGPAHLRFLIQPLLAILIGLRDARRDAQEGQPPFFLSVLSRKGQRALTLEEGLKHVALPLTLGVVIDSVVQLIVLHRLYLGLAIVVGTLLVALPYMLSRGGFNRAFSHRPRHA
jgi:hypothetical protein